MKNKMTLDELNEYVDECNEKGFNVDLSSLTSIPDGFNPTVGGGLDLRSLTSIPDGFNPTVGGNLYLRSLTSIPDGFNPTVGGYLDLSSLTSIPENRVKVKRFRQGEYVEGKYLYADGILTHIKRKKRIGEYTYFIGKIFGDNVIFDGENYAHCKTFRDGVIDLKFKAASERGADQYNELTLDSVVKYEDARNMYRIITGACQQGTQHFIDGLKEIKDEYTIREIVELTKCQFGHETFKKFFER